MSDLKVEGAGLKKILKVARKQPVPFGFNPGSSDSEHYLAAHRKKPAAIIGKDAKAEGPGRKYAFGTMALEGKTLKLTCEREVPMLAKTLKKYLKSQKIALNVEVFDINGNPLDSDVEDGLPDDPELAESEETTGDDEVLKKQLAALGKRLAAVKAAIQKLPPQMVEKLSAAFAKAVGFYKAQDVKSSMALLVQIEAALKKVKPPEAPPAPPANPKLIKLAQLLKNFKEQAAKLEDAPKRESIEKVLARVGDLIRGQNADAAETMLGKVREALKAALLAQKAAAKPEEAAPEPDSPAPLSEAEQKAKALWEAAFKELEPKVNPALSKGLVDKVDNLRKGWNYAMGSAADGNFTAAMKVVPAIRKILESARSEENSAFKEEIGSEVKPFAESRLKWRSARQKMQVEIEKLKKSILDVCNGDETLDEVAGKVGDLTGYLDQLDSRLEDKLDQIVNAKDGKARDGLKVEARSLLASYRKELEKDFFLDVDKNSGFANVAVASTAHAALGDIEKVLA